MQRKNKILVTVAALPFLIIGFDCLIGFSIGGEFDLMKALMFIISSLLLTAFSIIFINGREYTGTKEFLSAIIWIGLLIFLCTSFMYSGLNTLSAKAEYDEYKTTVNSTFSGHKEFAQRIYFNNREGIEVSTRDYTMVWFDDETYPDTGAELTVQERMGGFGYPIYKIVEVNGKPER